MGTCSFISSIKGARKCLGGIEFPATKEEIVESVTSSGGPEAVIIAADQLPDRTYIDLDELIEYLDMSNR